MATKRLNENQIRDINLMVRLHGAANLEVVSRKNKTSWAFGFRIWNENLTTSHTESCFAIPFDQEPDIAALTSEIERHLDACMMRPEVAL